MTKLKTLDELEENSSLNLQNQQQYQDQTNQIEEVFNIKLENRSDTKNSQLDPNLIVSPRSTFSNSSNLSNLKHHGKKMSTSSISSKSKRKTSSMSERSVSSMSNKSNIDDVTIINLNDDTITETQSIISNIQKDNKIVNSIRSNSPKLPPEPVNYDKICPLQCADLTKIQYINQTEKYLITRLYSNVGKLSSIINELNSINLKYYLNTPDENDCLPLYYAIKADCINSVKLLLDMGASISRTTAAGDPAAHLACLLGVSIELIDYLLLNATYNTQNFLYLNDQEGWTILHCAANQGHLHILKYLLEQKFMSPNVKDSKNRYTALQLAAINDRLNIIEYLLSFNTKNSITNRHLYKRSNSLTLDTRSKEVDLDRKNNNQFISVEMNNEKNSHIIKQTASLIGSDDKKTSLNSSHTNANKSGQSNFKIDLIEKHHHSNSIDSDKSLFNLSYRSNMSSFNNKIRGNLVNENDHRLSLISTSTALFKPNNKAFSKNSKNNSKKSTHSNSISQISTISEYREDDDLDTERSRSVVKKNSACKPIISLESMNVYLAANKYLNEPISIYNNFLIDLESQTSDGQNVLHLACRYGKYEIVKLFLNKYGSNELNINAVDFKSRTCMDLAWEWCLNIFGIKNDDFSSNSKTQQLSLFYDEESSIYVQRCFLIDDNKDFEEQIKLINLLNSYGAKFSHYKYLLYDIDMLKKVEEELVNLPSNLFHPDDHVSFQNIRLNVNIIVPIKYYLKFILYLFKLNLNTMFITNKSTHRNENKPFFQRSNTYSNLIDYDSNKFYNWKNDFNSNVNLLDNQVKHNNSNTLNDTKNNEICSTPEIKQEFEKNLNELTKFVQKYVIDKFEANIYYESIQEAFELLKNIK